MKSILLGCCGLNTVITQYNLPFLGQAPKSAVVSYNLLQLLSKQAMFNIPSGHNCKKKPGEDENLLFI